MTVTGADGRPVFLGRAMAIIRVDVDVWRDYLGLYHANGTGAVRA